MLKFRPRLPRFWAANDQLEAELHYAGQIDNTREMLDLADGIISDLNTYLLKSALGQASPEPAEHVAWAQTQRNAVMEVQAGCVALERAQRNLLSTYVRCTRRIYRVRAMCLAIWLVVVFCGYAGVINGMKPAVVASMFVIALLVIVVDMVHALICRRMLRNSERAVTEHTAGIKDAYSRYQAAKREGPHP